MGLYTQAAGVVEEAVEAIKHATAFSTQSLLSSRYLEILGRAGESSPQGGEYGCCDDCVDERDVGSHLCARVLDYHLQPHMMGAIPSTIT